MNAGINRRVFVASAAAGFPVVAAAVYGLAAAAPGDTHHHGVAAGDPDPVFDHVLRELAAIQQRGKLQGVTGGDARAIAAQLRTAAVYGRHIGIDAAAKRGVQSLIRRRGREAVLALAVDTTKAKARLTPYGIDVDDRWFEAA